MRSFGELEQCALFGEKVSHALRTPLGVCLGALEDLLSGYTLGNEELKDARDAARNIAKQLDLLRDFSLTGEKEKLVSLFEVFRKAGIAFEKPERDLKMLVFPELFPKALRALWNYLSVLSKERSTPPAVKIEEDGNHLKIIFSFEGTKLEESSDLFKLIKTDSRLESLGALYAFSVCKEMGAQLDFKSGYDAKMKFIIRGAKS